MYCLWFLLPFVVRTAAQSCTLCFDGSDPNLDAMIGETSCNTIATAIQQTPADDPRCPQTQVQGFLHCDCPALPDSVCSLCPVGVNYTPIAPEYRDLMLPGGGSNGITCGDAEFPSRDDAAGLCDFLSADDASFCGCAGAAARNDCFLCGPNTTTDDIAYRNRLLPPDFTTSCASLDRQWGLTCTEWAFNDWTADRPIAVSAYCGCPQSDGNVTSVCTNGGGCGNAGALLSNATISIGNATTTITCRDWDTMLRQYITDAAYCETLSSEYASVCCQALVNPSPPSAVPAPTPAVTASVPAPVESAAAVSSLLAILTTTVLLMTLFFF
jgi:hypothetical protein